MGFPVCSNSIFGVALTVYKLQRMGSAAGGAIVRGFSTTVLAALGDCGTEKQARCDVDGAENYQDQLIRNYL